MKYTPQEIELLKNAGLKIDNEEELLGNNNSLDQARQKEVEQSLLGQTDSTFGILGNRLSTQLADELPRNLAAAGKNIYSQVVADPLSNILPGSTVSNLNKNIDTGLSNYIDKQKQESIQSENALTKEAQSSTTREVGDIIGGVGATVVPLVAGTVAGGLLGGIPGAVIGGVGTASTIGAGGSANEFADRRREELINTGISPEDIQKKIDEEQKSVFNKSLANEVASNALSIGIGGAVGKGVIGGLKAGSKAALIDAPLGAVSGVIDENIVGGSLDSGVNKEILAKKALLGGVLGGGISGVVGGLGGRANRIQAENTLNEARQSNIQVKAVSTPLEETGAYKRLEFLNKTNSDPSIKFEVRDFVDQNGNSIKNRKQIFAIKEEMPIELPKVEEQAIKNIDETLNNTQETLNQGNLEQLPNQEPIINENVKQAKEYVKAEPIDVNNFKEENIKDLVTGDLKIDLNTDKIEKRTIRESYKDENGVSSFKTKDIYVPENRDNLGKGLTLEQTLKDKAEFQSRGLNDNIIDIKTDKLDFNELSDSNKFKQELIASQTSKGADQNLSLARNMNIIDKQNKGVYDFHSRNIKTKDGNKNVLEFLTSINVSKSEPFLKGVRELNDNQEITLVREKTDKFPENTAIYADGVKVGRLERNVAREFSKFLDSNSIDKIKAKLVSIEVPTSKKDKNDRTRQVYNKDGKEVVGRTGLVVSAELNKNADNLTYTIKNGDKTFESPIFNTATQNKGEIVGVNFKNKDLVNEKIKTEPLLKENEVNNTKLTNEDVTVKEKENIVNEVKQYNKTISDDIQNKVFKTENETEVKLKTEFLKENETFKNIRSINDIVNDVNLKTEDKKIELKQALTKLQNMVSGLDVHNVNNKIKVLVDFKGSDTLYSKQELNIINKIKQNNDGPGTMYTNPKGEKTVFINLDSVKKTALKSGMQVEDYAKFVYSHEVLGHGALRTFFKTEKELNTYLDNVFDRTGDGVKYLLDLKSKTYGFTEGMSELDYRRELMEEVIADLSSGKVSYAKNGKMIVQTSEEFAKDFATNVEFKDKSYKQVVKEFLDFIRGFINDITKNDVFKVYESTKNDLQDINLELKEMQKTLDINSKEIIDVNNFIKSSTPETMKFIRDIANNPDYLRTDVHDLKLNQKLVDLLGTFGENFKWLGTMLGKANRDPVFKVGFDRVTSIDGTAKSVDYTLSKITKDMFQESKLGWKKGQTKEQIEIYNKALFETQKNNRLLTETELKQKFNFTDKMVNDYSNYLKALTVGKDLKLMSEIYKEAFNLGLKSEEMNAKYKNLTERTYDDFVSEIRKDLSSIADPKKLDNIIEEKNQLRKEVLDFNIAPTGTHYLYVKNQNGEIVQFEQFNSLFQANSAKKRIIANNRNVQGLEVNIDKSPVKIVDIEDPQNKFNVSVNLYKDYSLRNYDGNGKAPFNYYRDIFKNIDDISRNTSLNIHLPILNKYIKDLKDSGNNVKANEIEALKDYVLSKDGVLVGKIKAWNSIWNLGGSVASGFSNLMSIPLVVSPYLSRYDGGFGNVYTLGKTLAKVFGDTKLLFGNMDTDSLVNHLLTKYIETNDIEKAKVDLKRLIETSIIKETADFDISKIKDGIDITSKKENFKNIAIDSFMLPFAKTELINRYVTGISALNTAYKNGLDGYTFTRDTIYSTQGYYGKAGRPVWARSGPGQLIFQFKNFALNYAELMMLLAKNSASELKNRDKGYKDTKAFLYMTSTLLLLGGVKSLPFSGDTGDILDTARRVAGDETANTGKEIDDFMVKTFGDSVGKFVLYGAASEAGLPFNLQQRISFNNLIPGTNILDPANKDISKSLQEIGGPTASNSKNIIEGIKQFSKGNYYNSAYNIAPSSVRAISQGGKALVTGKFEDKKGNLVTDATTTEALWRIIGFQPANLAETYRGIERINLQDQNIKYLKGIIYDLYAEAIIDKNPEKRAIAKKLLDEFNKNSKEELKINKAPITKRVNDSRKTLKERYTTKLTKEIRGDFEKL